MLNVDPASIMIGLFVVFVVIGVVAIIYFTLEGRSNNRKP